jgi:hypothetical protein
VRSHAVPRTCFTDSIVKHSSAKNVQHHSMQHASVPLKQLQSNGAVAGVIVVVGIHEIGGSSEFLVHAGNALRKAR